MLICVGTGSHVDLKAWNRVEAKSHFLHVCVKFGRLLGQLEFHLDPDCYVEHRDREEFARWVCCRTGAELLIGQSGCPCEWKNPAGGLANRVSAPTGLPAEEECQF